MKLKIVIIGGILIATGLVLMYFSQSIGRIDFYKTPTEDYRKLEGTISQVSIDKPWLDGQIIVNGQSYPLRYRRYGPPIKLADFRMQSETTDVSPLHTFISYTSRNRRDGGLTQDEALKYYSDPEYVLDNIKKYGHPTFNKKEDSSGWKIFGEVIYKQYTIIVVELPSDRPEPLIVGYTLVQKDGQHFLDPGAIVKDMVLQRLSGNDYSLVTEVVEND